MHALEHRDVAWSNEWGRCVRKGDRGGMKKVPGKVPNKGEALRPQHFAQSYSTWWVSGLAISQSHTFELPAVLEVQRSEGAVLEGVNVAWKSRGGRCIW